MRRALLIPLAFLALSAWAGAQGPPTTLDAATQVKLFKSNRLLLEQLVDHGIGLANADGPIHRAEECRKTATTLANSLSRAAEDQDPERVVELAGLMGDVIRNGLVPNLNDAQNGLNPDSPGATQLAKVRANAGRDLDELPQRIPNEGKVADSQKVRDALAALQSLKASVGK